MYAVGHSIKMVISNSTPILGFVSRNMRHSHGDTPVCVFDFFISNEDFVDLLYVVGVYPWPRVVIRRRYHYHSMLVLLFA
jgi:hypothetical protein